MSNTETCKLPWLVFVSFLHHHLKSFYKFAYLKILFQSPLFIFFFAYCRNLFGLKTTLFSAKNPEQLILKKNRTWSSVSSNVVAHVMDNTTIVCRNLLLPDRPVWRQLMSVPVNVLRKVHWTLKDGNELETNEGLLLRTDFVRSRVRVIMW